MEKNNDSHDEPKTLPRGDFNLLGIKKNNKPKAKVIMVIGIGVMFLIVALGSIFFFAYRAMEANNPDKVDETKVKPDAALSAKQQDDNEIQKRREEILEKRREEEQRKAAEQQAQQQQPENNNNNQHTNNTKTNNQAPAPSQAYLRKLSGGVMVQETGGANSSQSSSTGNSSGIDHEDKGEQESVLDKIANAQANDGDALGSGSGEGRGSLSNLTGTSYAPTRAFMSPPRKFLLKRKSNVQCALYTKVKTDHPGFVKCLLTQPLYSSDGSVVLAEKGAELDGEQKIEIKPGQSSVFTTWTELETAGGVRANLNALGTGAMGESGTEAYVDYHTGQVFTGAVMLSFIQDAFASAANMTKRNSSTYSFDNSESNAENMATKTLDHNINIPPTGYVLPGTVINVIVAQDVDFSSVFTTRKQR